MSEYKKKIFIKAKKYAKIIYVEQNKNIIDQKKNVRRIIS